MPSAPVAGDPSGNPGGSAARRRIRLCGGPGTAGVRAQFQISVESRTRKHDGWKAIGRSAPLPPGVAGR